MRPLRIALIAAAAVAVVVVAAAAVVIARFDPNSYKPQIIEAVKRATGRTLALNGSIGLKPSLWPTIAASDVAFSNPAGFSRPQMATLQGLELQLALLPLLSSRIEIDRLVLIRPDILLETEPSGQPNWQMTPEVAPSVPGNAQAPVQSGKTTTVVSVESIRIQDGTIGYRDGRSGKVTTLGLPKLEAKAASPDAPLHVDANGIYNATAFSLAADTGSLSRLQDPAATSPWAVKLAVSSVGATLAAEGALTQPLQGKGYDLAISGTVPDAAALAPLLPGIVPPPLHDVRFAAKVADSGGPVPVVSAFSLHAGASDLSARYPGLMMDRLDVAAATADQPVKLDASGKLSGQGLVLAATTGPLTAWLPGAKPGAFPVDVALQAAGATLSAKGAIANLPALTGANLALTAQVPDLSALSPLAGRPLPAVKQLGLHGTLTDAPGGLVHGAALRGLSLTSADGDLSGDLAMGLGARPSLTGVLKSGRIDLDALQAAIDQMPAAPAPAPAPAPAKATAPAGAPAPATPGTPPAASPAPAAAKRTDRLFSDRPLPLDGLRAADADLTLDIADLRSGGADYRAIATHGVLAGGKLTVDPFVADLPGGHLTGSLAADASQAAPLVHLVLRAPGLALNTLLAAAHQPAYASGNLEVYADLHGAGDTPHMIAASLEGGLGLAMAGGTIDNRLLGSLLGKVMDTLNAMDLVGKGGTSEIRCFGLRMDAQHGTASIKALSLASSLLTMTGGGAVNLGAETLALELRPQAKLAGSAVEIPLEVTGPIRNPAVKVNKIGAAQSNAGTVAGAVVGSATPLGIVGGLLGGGKALGGGSADLCTPALAAARGQVLAGPAAAPPPAPASKPAAPNAGAVLKNLFR